MDFDTYQELASETAVYPVLGHPVVYPALGLNGEAGEVAEKIKKLMRDNRGTVTEDVRQSIAKELGDVLWYVAEVARQLELSLSHIARLNLCKLASRAERNTLSGEGDNR